MIVKGGFVHVAFALIKRITIKTDINTYYNITLFSSANIGRNYWFRGRYQMI